MRCGEPFQFGNVEELPPEAAVEVEWFRLNGLKSNVTLPLIANGRPFGAIAFATLGRERKWTADEITELQLVAQIIATVTARQRAEERAEQLRREMTHSARAVVLGELTAALAHELNQPLTAILSNAQAAQRCMKGGFMEPAMLGEILSDIIRDGKRAGGVVHNLMAMLRNAQAAREICCMNELIREVAEFTHSEFVVQEITLELRLAPLLPPVRVARVELQQVLLNLVINAIHAMKDVLGPERCLEISSCKEGGSVTVRVRDHGCGIAPELLDSLFVPFFTTKTTGLGMGLAICQRLINAHEGTLNVRNVETGGAEFAFSIPVAMPDDSSGG